MNCFAFDFSSLISESTCRVLVVILPIATNVSMFTSDI